MVTTYRFDRITASVGNGGSGPKISVSTLSGHPNDERLYQVILNNISFAEGMSGILPMNKRSICFGVVFPNVHTCPLVSSRERSDGW